MTQSQIDRRSQTITDEPIHLSSPDIGLLEEQAVLDALRSGWIAPAGPDLNAFETEIAEKTGVAHAVGLASGTAALHLGLLALGVRPGDIVITTTLTFAATANAIVYVGAEPFFIDVDAETGNMDPLLLDMCLHYLRRNQQHVAAIVPVDLFGKVADYPAIEEIAAKYEVPVLADAAEALGARHRGRSAGGFGDAAVLSFNGNKIMTTSGGGILLTDNQTVAEKVRYLSTQARQPVAHYEHTEIGYNYRLSNLLAALGRAQLQRLDAMMFNRRWVREQYRAWSAKTAGTRVLGGESDSQDNCWLTPLLIDPRRHPGGVDGLIGAMAQCGIEARRIWKPMHLQPVFAGARRFLTGVAEDHFASGVVLPSGSNMTTQQMDRVLNVLDSYLGNAQ